MASTEDWHEFVESVSLVDEILRRETNFGELDFATRDTYRHAIEDLARGSGQPAKKPEPGLGSRPE